jgi:hypothetical protein
MLRGDPRVIIDGSYEKEASWRLMGRLHYTTVLVLLHNYSVQETPIFPPLPRASKKWFYDTRALLDWNDCHIGATSSAGLVRAPVEKLAEDLRVRGWHLAVKKTFLEVSEIKPKQRRRHSCGK